MTMRPETRTADLLGVSAGSDNNCSVDFAISEARTPAVVKRRAPRVGLRGGRYTRHSSVDRFWSRVQKKTSAECWLIDGHPDGAFGYVHVTREDGSRLYAHRFSYELHRGPIPDGLKVCHTCDVPRCVNPSHLFIGSQKANVHDAIRKGRRNAFGRQVLTVEAALDIRARFAAGETQKSIAAALGVSKGCVHAVVYRRSWAHLSDQSVKRQSA